MSGNPSSLTTKQKLDRFTEDVREFMKGKGYPIIEPRPVEQYLSMSKETLSRLSPEELQGIAFEINSYAFYLQDVINEAKGRLSACSYEIKKVGADTAKFAEYRQYNQGIIDKTYGQIQRLETHIKILGSLSYIKGPRYG